MSAGIQAAITTMLTTGSAPPVGPVLSGTISIDADNDNLPPFFTAVGIQYDVGPPVVEPPSYGVLNFNGTIATLQSLYVQKFAGIPTQVVIAVQHTEFFDQDAFTSMSTSAGALPTIYSADASDFQQNDLGGGYYQTQWTIPVTAPGDVFDPGTYDFNFV